MDEKVEAFVKLYERQMAHYENTQGIEWKVSIGVWTLLAATTAWASNNLEAATSIPTWVWWIALLLVVGAHFLWLWSVHRSEEKDKELWCKYRGEVEKILLGTAASSYQPRSKPKEALWLVSEAGVTAGMALLLGFLVSNARAIEPSGRYSVNVRGVGASASNWDVRLEGGLTRDLQAKSSREAVAMVQAARDTADSSARGSTAQPAPSPP